MNIENLGPNPRPIYINYTIIRRHVPFCLLPKYSSRHRRDRPHISLFRGAVYNCLLFKFVFHALMQLYNENDRKCNWKENNDGQWRKIENGNVLPEMIMILIFFAPGTRFYLIWNWYVPQQSVVGAQRWVNVTGSGQREALLTPGHNFTLRWL